MNNQPTNKNQSREKNHKRKNDKDTMYKAREAMQQLRDINKGEIPSDTMGSYTGTSYDDGNPEQDADDL